MGWITGECGYTIPEPIEPEDERARLQREYIDAAKAMARLADKIERTATAGPRLAA